jgi:hypothetical protein
MTVFSVTVDDIRRFTWKGDLAAVVSDFLNLMSRAGHDAHSFARNSVLAFADSGFSENPDEEEVIFQALVYFSLRWNTDDPLHPGEFLQWTSLLERLDLLIWARQQGGFTMAIDPIWCRPDA